jgi:hypothetical protein
LENETLAYRSLRILVEVWYLMYEPMGWKVKSPIQKKWRWKKFGYVYEMVAEREKAKQCIEFVDNKSETNTHKICFTTNNERGDFYRKEFYCNPSLFNQSEEFEKWNMDKKKTPCCLQKHYPLL